MPHKHRIGPGLLAVQSSYNKCTEYNRYVIKNPMLGIRREVSEVVNKLVPDKGGSYDTTHKRRYARTLEVILDQNPTGKLLELGTSDIIPVALKMLGLDLDVSVTEFDLDLPIVGSRICSAGGVEVEVERYSLDLESTEFPVVDGLFDTVICCEVLEHMDVDPMFMLGEANRITCGSGKLILTTPNVTSSRGLWKMMRGVEPYFFMQYHKDRSPYRHNYEHSVDTVSALMSGAGYSFDVWTEDTFEDGILEDVLFLENAGFEVNRDRLGDNIFVVGTKETDVVDRHPALVYV